jgi:hypothetical protein
MMNDESPTTTTKTDPQSLVTFWEERARTYRADLAAAIAEDGATRARVEAGLVSPVAAEWTHRKARSYRDDWVGAVKQAGYYRALLEDAEAWASGEVTLISEEEPETVTVWAEGRAFANEAELAAHLRAAERSDPEG